MRIRYHALLIAPIIFLLITPVVYGQDFSIAEAPSISFSYVKASPIEREDVTSIDATIIEELTATEWSYAKEIEDLRSDSQAKCKCMRRGVAGKQLVDIPLGEEFDCTATIDNTSTAGGGPVPVTNVVGDVSWPSAFSQTNQSIPPGGSCEGHSNGSFCTFATMAAGQIFDMIFSFIGVSEGQFGFGLGVSQNEFDPNPNNNFCTTPVNITSTPPASSSIHGQKWIDVNADGVKDAEEVGMNDVDIMLDGPGGMQTTTTHEFDEDGDGNIDPLTEWGLYWFEGLAPGEYDVWETIPERMDISWPPFNLHVVNLGSNDKREHIDFGNVPDALDWGDLPDPRIDIPGPCPIGGVPELCYRTLKGVQGAAHILDPFFPNTFVLGARVDAELDGQPTPQAHGDDINIGSQGGVDDEDGLISAQVLPDGTIRLEVLVTDAFNDGGFLDVFLDLNGDGVLNDGTVPGGTREHVIHAAVVNGINIVDSLPGTFLEGDEWGYIRLRLSYDGMQFANFVVWGGEVEDYTFFEFDFGDAPSVNNPERPLIPGGYPTTFAQNGAFHRISPGFMMGELNEDDPDGQPTDFANGDDAEEDDEDGVKFASDFIPLLLKLTPGSEERTLVWGATIGDMAKLEVTTSAAGNLDIWTDFNRDGDWTDPGEHHVDGLGVPAGVNEIDYSVPVGSAEGISFVRVRFSTTGDVTDDKYWGIGEVEDYIIQLISKTDLGSVDDTDDANPGDGICADLSGNCTLRAAIQESNASGLAILLDASLLGKNGRVTLQPQTPYPVVTGTVLLNGAGTLEIDGSQAGAGANGFELAGPGSIISSTLLHSFGGAGVRINEDDNTVFNNIIRNNGGAGVEVVAGDNNRIRTNSIYDNGGLGIDLQGDGVTQNDVGDVDIGPNHLQNTPVIAGATAEDGHIIGNIDTIPNAEITVDFFASPTCDPSGYGEGRVYVGSALVNTDNVGDGQFDLFVDVNPFNIGDAITATATDPDGSTSEFASCLFAVTTDIERNEEVEIPTEYELFQNYPNPFNPVTHIRFAITNREWVNLEVYDILGKRVATLVDGYVEAGEFNVEFDASHLPSGIYLYRMTAGSFTTAKQLTLLK